MAARVGMALVSGVLLASCATQPQTADTGWGFRVVSYEPPIDTSEWHAGPALAGNPEGAAYNIADAMRRGDVDTWLSYCRGVEANQVDAAEREMLTRQWAPLKGRQFVIVTRVLAETDVVIEFSATGAGAGGAKLQIPLTKAAGRWWLTTLDATSEFLHWEGSRNKVVDHLDPYAFANFQNPAFQAVQANR